MKTYLKIKVMSLAAEAQIIRREQRRWKKDTPQWGGLDHHRREDVRKEARSAGLAYGFLRGREYRRIEAKSHTKPNWKRVQQLVEKYGEGDARDLRQRFASWMPQA